MMNIHTNTKTLLCALLTCAAATGSANAAPITWGPATNVGLSAGNSSDVSTTGTLVEAYNGVGVAVASGSVTVNGVTFVNSGNLLPTNANQSTQDTFFASNSGDASYDALLSSSDFGGGESTTITIGDGDGNSAVTGAGLLQIGQLYAIQVWYAEDRNGQNTGNPQQIDINNRTMGFGSSSSASIVQLNDQFAIGTFVADATTQTLFLDTVSPSVSFGQAHITAYQIREVPEPGSLALLGLGGLLVARRRRD